LVVALLVLPVLGLVGAFFYYAAAADWELRAAIAEADRLGPPWRLEDVEAARAVLPDARNSAVAAMAAKRLLPNRWPAWEWPLPGEDRFNGPGAKRAALQESFQDLQPQQPLNEEQIATLRAELQRAGPALAEARKLAGLPEGRYPIRYSPDFLGTLVPHAQDAREIARLLAYDVLLRAQDGDADGALASCRAILNDARSIGDEPLGISQLVRIACRITAVDKAQRALARGEPSEAALLQLQQLLEKEEPGPLLLIVARGERAGQDRFMEAVQTGQVKLSGRELTMAAGLGGAPQAGPSAAETLALRSPAFRKRQRAAVLRYLTRAVEIAKLPPEQRRPQLKQWEAAAKDQPVFVRLLAPALGKIADACERSQVQLRCAIVAVAAERYRRARGQWPDKLEALKEAGYLREVPTDLYDGRPLRLRRRDDGVVVYSVGPDGEDNGGRLDFKNPVAPGMDLGFRLWDTAARR
jgi:hypothetical protein